MKLENVFNASYQHYIADDFLATYFFNKRIPLVITNVNSDNVTAVRDKLLDCYGDVEVSCVGEEEAVKVSELCATDDDIMTLVVDGCKVTECKRFDFSDFVQIMKRLRADDGCEWDRAQTHESIRINLIEEAYELDEAIDCKSAEMMREECGDVLMQAVFHTEIAEKNGEFNYCDMLTELCRKLIDRHTHIFGENHASNADEALVFWNEAKKKEKKYKSTSDAMNRVPKNLPALMYVDKILKLAKKAGFYWDNTDGALDKVREELVELKEANDSDAHRVEEAGDVLLAAVKAVRMFGVEPEMALREAGDKYLRRFAFVEQSAKAIGKETNDCTLEELMAFWNMAKSKES